MTTAENGTASIGAVASKLGVSVDALRYYERAGLVAPTRNASGHRRFRASDVDALQVVLALRRAGVAIEDIRGIVAGKDPSRDPWQNVAGVQSRLAALEARIRDQQRQLATALSLLAGWSADLEAWLRDHPE
jgi:MerR family redox-sensitive transcriptional activator SoxR